MKRGIALLAFCAVLAICLPALCEPGDEPCCPWERMPYAQVLEMEELRDAQTVGGVVGSPYWLWQAYLGSGSLSLRLYDVTKPVFPVQLMFRERVRYAGASTDEKTMTLTVRQELERVELRLDREAIALLERAGITRLCVVNGKREAIADYRCADIAAVFDFFEVGEEETLCLQGDDAPIYVYSEDWVRRAVSVGN